MENLSEVSDKELVLEIYRRIQGEDEISEFKNYCYRAVFRPLLHAFDKRDADESNLRLYVMPNWEKIEAERDDALKHFP